MDPNTYTKLRDAYLQAVGSIFEKYNRDVAFLFFYAEDHIGVVQKLQLQMRYALGIFLPFEKSPMWMQDFSTIPDDRLESLDSILETVLKSRKVLSDEELDSSDVPLNPYYPRYEAKKKQEEQNSHEYTRESKLKIVETLKKIHEKNVNLQEKITDLSKEMAKYHHTLLAGGV